MTCECNRFGKPCGNTAEHQFDITGIWYCAECWAWLQNLLNWGKP
jgi:hypothetical protein